MFEPRRFGALAHVLTCQKCWNLLPVSIRMESARLQCDWSLLKGTTRAIQTSYASLAVCTEIT